MLKASVVVGEINLSNVDNIISFLEGVEKSHQLKITFEKEERIKNAGKYRHSVNFKYVSIEAYDLYSEIITKEIESILRGKYEELKHKSNQRDLLNARVSAAFGADLIESSELFDTLDVIFKKDKQVGFSHSIYIVFKEKLTQNLLMQSCSVPKKVEVKKKKFWFF